MIHVQYVSIDPGDHFILDSKCINLSVINLKFMGYPSYSLLNAGENYTKMELHIIIIDQIK